MVKAKREAGEDTELAADKIQLIVVQRGSIPRSSQKVCRVVKTSSAATGVNKKAAAEVLT